MGVNFEERVNFERLRNDGMMKATGRGDLDFSALILLMEELAGIKEPFKS